VLRISAPIRTDRLTLRPFADGDLDGLYRYLSDPDVVRYMYWEIRDHESSAEALQERIGQDRLDDDHDYLALAVVPDESGEVAGEVILRWLSRPYRQGEVGFAFAPGFQGRGYAREAAEAMLQLAFRDLGLHRVIGRCDPRNKASARTLEQLGMRLEAHFVHNEIFKGEWGDELYYAMLEDEWAARHLPSPDRRAPLMSAPIDGTSSTDGGPAASARFLISTRGADRPLFRSLSSPGDDLEG
jgi:RimJ/RimL family protein N-acetyltransferase